MLHLTRPCQAAFDPEVVPFDSMVLTMAFLNMPVASLLGALFTRMRFVAVHLSPLMTGHP